MLRNIWNSISEWFLDRSERNAVIRSFNSSARDAFVRGVAPTLLKAQISRGDREYKHQFSHWYSTGFRIQALSGTQLSKKEMMYIGEVVLNDEVLVRKLVVLGWDTLEVHGDVGSFGCKWRLRDHLQLSRFND